MRIHRELLERILVTLGLGRLAPADLVRRDDSVAGVVQGSDRLLPGRGAEVLAVQDDRRLSVRFRRCYVHVAHNHGFALRLEGEIMNRPRIVEALQLRSVGRGLGMRAKPAREQRHCDECGEK
jgi:hypothetical protein